MRARKRSCTTTAPTTPAKSIRFTMPQASEIAAIQGECNESAATNASNANGMLKVSEVPKWPLGREKRVLLLQRTWWRIESMKPVLSTMWSMA